MSIKVCSSYLSSIGCQNPHFTPHSGLTPTQQLTLKKKINGPTNPLQLFLQHTSTKYGFSRGETEPTNFQLKASSSPPPPPPPPSPPPSPANSSSSHWKKWLMGAVISVVLPAAGHKGGLFVALKAKIDQTIATVDTITDVVEDIAEQADKLVDQVESTLPKDSKFKKAIERLDQLTDIALQHAQKADDLVDQVKDLNEKVFDDVIGDDVGQENKGKPAEPSTNKLPPKK